ncbi:MAG TPA: hypothetical protein VFE37_17745 [Chloroflexota bacterium]|nr:hypothetical protein [Chloroflexota bacterium]
MRDSIPGNIAARPTAVFRAALGEAAERERGRKMLRGEKRAAVAGLRDEDLGQLITTFDALLRGASDVTALTAELHAALRALSPAPTDREDDDA